MWPSFEGFCAYVQVDKLHKEKEPYLAEAAAFLRAEVASAVPQIIQQVRVASLKGCCTLFIACMPQYGAHRHIESLNCMAYGQAKKAAMSPPQQCISCM